MRSSYTASCGTRHRRTFGYLIKCQRTKTPHLYSFVFLCCFIIFFHPKLLFACFDIFFFFMSCLTSWLCQSSLGVGKLYMHEKKSSGGAVRWVFAALVAVPHAYKNIFPCYWELINLNLICLKMMASHVHMHIAHWFSSFTCRARARALVRPASINDTQMRLSY